MKRVALVTYEGNHPTLRDDEILQEELIRRGIDVGVHAWSDPGVAWRDFDLLVIRSTWDYHRRLADFEAWLDRVSKLRILNSPALVRWNLRKTYLPEIQGADLPVTLFGDEINARRLQERPRWLIKPIVGLGAEGIRELRPGDTPDPATCFVQEWVPEITTNGEISLVFIDGRFVQAVRKRPAAGDFRVQQHLGGTFETLAAPPGRCVEAGKAILSGLPEIPLYARVDGIERGDRFSLMELELIEPELFLRLAPEVTLTFAEAIQRRL